MLRLGKAAALAVSYKVDSTHGESHATKAHIEALSAGIDGSLRASAVLLAKISHVVAESEKREGGRNRRPARVPRGAGN